MKLKLIPAAHELISNMRTFFQVSDTKKVRKLSTDSIKRKYQETPAGEWLIEIFTW